MDLKKVATVRTIFPVLCFFFSAHNFTACVIIYKRLLFLDIRQNYSGLIPHLLLHRHASRLNAHP